MEESKNTNNISFFNYLKAFAIILVITHHYNHSQELFSTPFLLYVIYMAIPVFMTVTGYVYTKSYLRNNIDNFKNLYDIKIILKLILRISIPFLLVFIIEYCFNMNGLHDSNNLMSDFIHGGAAVDKGSYYYPVILQVIFIFPLIYILIKKLGSIGFALLVLFEYIYHCFCYYTGLPVMEYKFQALRYVTLIASGTWLALNPEYEIKRKYLLLSFLAGAVYIYISGYINYPTIPYDYEYWKNASGIFIILYIFPVLYLLYKKYGSSIISNKLGFALENIGRASWHIYLCQMLYYISIDKLFTGINPFLRLFLCLSVCIVSGLIFWFLERKIVNLIRLKYFVSQK